jgi:hypothetical protein
VERYAMQLMQARSRAKACLDLEIEILNYGAIWIGREARLYPLAKRQFVVDPNGLALNLMQVSWMVPSCQTRGRT